MASNGTNTDLANAEILWKSADALRGQVDAAEYKHVVLGLLFLKYISDAFEARRDELKVELELENCRPCEAPCELTFSLSPVRATKKPPSGG